MKIPKQLKIGGHIVKVVYEDMENDLGKTVFSDNKLVLAKGIEKSQAEAAFFHEILHFINPTLDSTALGHALLDSIAEQLYQVLSENKLLK
jgi:hypothetical protein